MNKSLKALAARRSTLESLKIQGRSILHRGNVSMEEADSFLALTDAVLSGDAPATISSTVGTNPDADSKLELTVMEVDRQLESTNNEISTCDQGQVPPADSVVSMDADEATSVSTLLDEAEELDALAEYGSAIQDDPSLDQGAALESYKGLVKDCWRRAGLSFESIDQTTDIQQTIAEVETVRNTADQVITSVVEQGSTISTESFQEIFGEATEELRAIFRRADEHVARVAARKEIDNVSA